MASPDKSVELVIAILLMGVPWVRAAPVEALYRKHTGLDCVAYASNPARGVKICVAAVKGSPVAVLDVDGKRSQLPANIAHEVWRQAVGASPKATA